MSSYHLSLSERGTMSVYLYGIFFFFQAEDGIRDVAVTGVQTCALPIYPPPRLFETAAGMLNSIGLQNIGARAFVEEKLPRLQRKKNIVAICNVFGYTRDRKSVV